MNPTCVNPRYLRRGDGADRGDGAEAGRRSVLRLLSIASFGFVGSSGSFLKPPGVEEETVSHSRSRVALGSGPGGVALPLVGGFFDDGEVAMCDPHNDDAVRVVPGWARPPVGTTGTRSRQALTLARAAAFIAFLGFLPPAHADNFESVSYDPAADELVVVVAYTGTNPDHQFSVQWGPCVDHGDAGREIAGELLDQQSRDEAKTDFTKTVRVSLADMDCRPAAVTLRTAPRFYYTLTVPARAGTRVRP